MAYSNVKPYLNLKRSTAKLYREPPRFLASSIGPESKFEKPYLDTDHHRSVQLGHSGPDWPAVRVPDIRHPEWLAGNWTPRRPPKGPVSPETPEGGLTETTCNYCMMICDEPTDCKEPVECHTLVWCSYAPHDWSGSYWTVEAIQGTVTQMMSNQQVNPGGAYYIGPDGKKQKGIGSIPGTYWKIFPDIQVWVEDEGDAILEICFHDPLKHVCCETVKLECCSCDTDVNPFTIDDTSTPDTIAPGGSITVYVDGGCPPYDWSVAGTGYSFTNATTEIKSNILNCAAANGGGCDADYGPVATITVTDGCGTTATSALDNDKIRNTDAAWDPISDCDLHWGSGSTCHNYDGVASTEVLGMYSWWYSITGVWQCYCNDTEGFEYSYTEDPAVTPDCETISASTGCFPSKCTDPGGCEEPPLRNKFRLQEWKCVP